MKDDRGNDELETAELVEELREKARVEGQGSLAALLMAAADRLEALDCIK